MREFLAAERSGIASRDDATNSARSLRDRTKASQSPNPTPNALPLHKSSVFFSSAYPASSKRAKHPTRPLRIAAMAQSQPSSPWLSGSKPASRYVDNSLSSPRKTASIIAERATSRRNSSGQHASASSAPLAARERAAITKRAFQSIFFADMQRFYHAHLLAPMTWLKHALQYPAPEPSAPLHAHASHPEASCVVFAPPVRESPAPLSARPFPPYLLVHTRSLTCR